MRRARISVKPNFRPGGRSLPAGQQPSQTPADGNCTPPTVTAEEAVRPPPSPQPKPPVDELAEAVGVENAPNSPSEKTSADVNNGARSSCTSTPASVSQRRMRVSATPQLVGPKTNSTPQQSARKPRSVPSALPKDKASGSVNSVSLTESSMLSSKAPTEVVRQSSTSHTRSSPCVPSTSGLSKPPIHEKSSMEHSPPSPQPGQVPQQPSQKLEPHKCRTSESKMPSSYVKLSRFDEPGSQQKVAEMLSDKEKILRALKLKALMKIERRKDIKNSKREIRWKPEYTPVDRSKMTMRDLIYYLPNTSPMRGSTVSEENGEEAVVPPSPRLPVKTPEVEEEEEEEECEDQDLLVPKVRVAEDGSIILDEESLTVRVQRNSNTKVVEGSMALFEQGSTTTYASFRNLHYVRSWSVRETDMFYLAISMVGTDFSLIGQLLPHRSRAEIKNKFKKEEKTNGWRIDKAFRNKRPYDREFFSFLLEKVLAKDKEKGKSVKLVMTNPRKRGKARGKKGKQNEEEYPSSSGAEEDFDKEDGSYMDPEKENEGLQNVNKADISVSAKKKRKGTNDISEDKNNENSSEEQGKEKKKRKRDKKTKKDMHSPEAEADAEGESGLFHADGDSVNADKDDELDSSMSAPKKKRKRSKKAEEERQDETSDERSKGKRSQKSLKASNKTDDSIGVDEENGIVDEDDSAAATKKRTVDDEGASVTAEADEASTIPEDAEASVTAEGGESSKAKKIDTLIPAEVIDKRPQRSTRQVKKPRPNLATGRHKEVSVPETADGDKIHESQNEDNSKFILEEEVSSLKSDKLQQQAVVVLERTPPRVQNLLSLSEVQQKNNESEASMNLPSPAAGESSSGQQIRMQRAERVKRSLTAERKKGKRKAVLDQDEAEHDPSTSAEDMQSPTVLLEQMATQEYEDPEAENILDERRPMVLLSREEVDMILNVQDQTFEDDPSVSPLDLSLNTELSFQLQCSSLMEENAEAAQVESVAEEYGEEILPQEMASSSVTFEEKQCEDMRLTEPELDQSRISTPAKSGVNKQLEPVIVAASSFLENAEPQVDSKTDKALQTVASEDPIHSKSDSPVIHETFFPEAVTHCASLPSQYVVEESRTSLLVTPDIKEGSQGPVLASSDVFVRSQDSVEIKAGSQASEVETPEIKEGLQDLMLEMLEVKKGSQGSILTALEIKERPGGSKVPAPVFKDDSQEQDLLESPMEPSEILEKSKTPVVVTPEIKEGSRGLMLETLEVKKGSPGSALATLEIKEGSQDSIVTTEIRNGSQVSILTTLEIKERPEVSKEVVEQAVIPSTKPSSGASVSSDAALKRRSRFLKPKPNLSASSRFMHGSPKQKNTEPRKISSEKILPQSCGKDHHCNLEDLSNEKFSKEDGTSQSHANGMESESPKGSPTPVPPPEIEGPVDYSVNKTFVLSDASPTVPEQETITTVILNTSSAERLQLASEQTNDTCDMDTLPLCASVAEDLHMGDTTCILPLPTQTAEQENTGEMMSNFEELCAPAKIIQPTGDSNSEEEPTFILTLYEIPVAEPYPASASTDSPLLFSDQPTLPSTAESSSNSMSVEIGDVQNECLDIPQNELSGTIGPEEESDRTLLGLEEKTSPEMGDDLIKHSTPIEEPTKNEYSPAASGQLFTVTAESKDGPSLSEGKKAHSRRRGKLQPKLVQRTSGKEDSSKIDQPTSSQAVFSASQPTILPEIKQDSNTVSAKLEMEDISDSPKLQSSNTKGSSVLDSLQGKDLQQKLQITPCTVSLTRCVDLLTLESHRIPASEDDVPMEQTASEEKVADVPSEKDAGTVSTDRTSASQEIKAPIRRRGKLQVKPKLRVRPSLKKETKCDLKASPTELVHTISAALQEPELEKEASKLVMGDPAIKHDMESSLEDKESSLSMAHEAANLQSHDRMHFSVEAAASCFGSSPADSEGAEEDCEGASHMVLADIFVPVSEEMGDGLSQDLLIPSSPHEEDINLPKKQEVHPEEKPEESKESKTPIKRKDKQRTCTAKLEEVDVSDPPKVPDLEAKESSDQVNMEEQLRRRHQIMSCTVRVSRCTDSLPVDSEEIKEETEGALTDAVVPVSDKVGDNLSKKSMPVNKAASPSFTPSEGSREQSTLEDIKSEEPSVKVQKKSPTRKKCKHMVKFPLLKQTVQKTESSKSDPPNLEDSAVKLPLTISQTRQLTITAWAKKKTDQTGTKSEADNLPKASQMESNLKAKEDSPLPSAPHALKILCSRLQPADSSVIEKMSEDISHITLVPAEDAGEGSVSSTKIHELETSVDISPQNLKESKEEPSGSQINKSPAGQRVKPQMKPALLKVTPTKDEDNSKETDESQSTQLTSPKQQRTRSARAKGASEKASKKQTDDMSNAPRVETKGTERFLLTSDPQCPTHSALWPKVVLPRVKLRTTDAGSSSDSSTPTSPPFRVSTCASQPVTPKLKKSPAVTPEQSPPMSSEDTEDEPSKVSQFFVCDIFTEVEDEN
ncbi:hypothetical protein SRHO_G00262950 [Serrasalmus rhombeus]